MNSLNDYPDLPEQDSSRQGVYPCPNTDNLSDRMLDAMQTGIVFFDAQHVVFRTNAIARKELRTEVDLAGKKLTDLLAVISHNENILPSLLGRLAQEPTARVDLPADTIIRCLDRKVQFFANGCLTQLECGCGLISFRNTLEEITRDQIHNLVLARTKIFPWFYDMERDKMLIDPHWFSYLGIPAGDCTLSTGEFFARVHPQEREMLAEALQKQLSNHEIEDTFTYRLLRGDGTWEWFSEQSMYQARTGDGSPYRVIGVCLSIQEHKTIEEDLRTARNNAQESDRLKSAFLSNMSHEIRTPLNAVVGFSNLLAGGEIAPGSDDAKEYAALIEKNCEHLLTLVSDVLDLSRIETGTMEYDLTDHSLAKLLSEIYEARKPSIPGGIEFRLRLPADDLTLRTDALRLRQVLEHLIGNAVKFSYDADGYIELGYMPCPDGENVQLFVTDRGRGIAEEETEKIFDRFYKVDAFMQGAGLGLSVCKTVVEALGGTISVKSHPGQGSCFTVLLPLHGPGGNPCLFG